VLLALGLINSGDDSCPMAEASCEWMLFFFAAVTFLSTLRGSLFDLC